MCNKAAERKSVVSRPAGSLLWFSHLSAAARPRQCLSNDERALLQHFHPVVWAAISCWFSFPQKRRQLNQQTKAWKWGFLYIYIYMYCEPHLSKQRQLWTAGHAEVSISQWRCFFYFFLLYFGEESGQVQKGDLGCWARALVVVIFTIVVLASSSFSITRHAIRSRVRLTLDFQSVLWLSLCPCWFNSLLFHTAAFARHLLGTRYCVFLLPHRLL